MNNNQWLNVGNDLWEEDTEMSEDADEEEEEQYVDVVSSVKVIQLTAYKSNDDVEDEGTIFEELSGMFLNLGELTDLCTVSIEEGIVKVKVPGEGHPAIFEDHPAFFLKVSIPLEITWTKDILEKIMEEICEMFVRYFFDHYGSQRWSFKGISPGDLLEGCGAGIDVVYRDLAKRIKKWVEDTVPLFSQLMLTEADLQVIVNDEINLVSDTVRNHLESDENKRVLFLPVWRGTNLEKRSWSFLHIDDYMDEELKYDATRYGCHQQFVLNEQVGEGDVDIAKPLVDLQKFCGTLNVWVTEEDADQMIHGWCNACIPSWKTYPSLASKDVLENNDPNYVSAFHCQELAANPAPVHILVTIPIQSSLSRKSCLASERVYRTPIGDDTDDVLLCNQFMKHDSSCCTVTIGVDKVQTKVLPLVCAQRTVDFGRKLSHLKAFYDWYKDTHSRPNVHFITLEIDELITEGLYEVIKHLRPRLSRLKFEITQNRTFQKYVADFDIETCEEVEYVADDITENDMDIIAQKMPICKLVLTTENEFNRGEVNFVRMLQNIEQRQNFELVHVSTNNAYPEELESQESELYQVYERTCRQIENLGYRRLSIRHWLSIFSKDNVEVFFKVDEAEVKFHVKCHIRQTPSFID